MIKFRLNTGASIPAIGLGTWQGPPGKEAEVGVAIKDAINIGYRHFDCAHIYMNEKIIGKSLKELLDAKIVKREDLFITSKLWNTYHRPDLVKPALKTTLNNLGLEYLDLYLMHWPFGFKEGSDLRPMNENNTEYLFSDVDYLNTWKVMEEVYKKGLVKAIGVSNFNSLQIQRLIDNSTIVPAVNQVECHPFLNQRKLSNFCKERGILITAYSPLGSATRPWAKPEDPDVLNDESIKKIAEKLNKSPAQILLRYQIELGHATIPKSSNKQRLQENFEIFDFKLDDETISLINSFDCNGRLVPISQSRNHQFYPFKAEIEF